MLAVRRNRFLKTRKFRLFFKNMKHSNKPVEPKAPEGKIDLTDYHGSEQSRKTIMALNVLIDSIEKDSSENPKAKNNNAFNAYHELIMKMMRLAYNLDFQSLGWETDRNLLYDPLRKVICLNWKAG